LPNPGLKAQRFVSAQLSESKSKTLCLHVIRRKTIAFLDLGQERWAKDYTCWPIVSRKMLAKGS
jgi:hypothetical protein